VVTMLASPEALEQVVFGDDGVAAGLSGAAALIEMSTVGPEAVRDMAGRLPEGVDVLDAPVLGGVPQATDGTLEIFVGGPPDLLERWQPLLEGLRDLRVGSEVIVVTWLDRASRETLVTRPRDDPARPELGVFSTRSPDRPNPIGSHRVEIVTIDGARVQVRNLEALDGTPIVDVKPVLGRGVEG